MTALQTSDPVLIDFAAEVGHQGPVTVRGNGTRWDHGGPVDAAARWVSAPSGVVEYTPAEMTATVRAGTAVADLDRVLAASRQRSALPARGGTVGGAVMVGENDLGQRARGTVASAVLQVRYVSAEGHLITGGGPTVKNVTGFDLPRLLCGSLGTLGLLAEVTIRTNPIPASSRWLAADEADPFTVNDLLLRPSAVLWDGETVWVNLEGHGPDVDAEAARLSTAAAFAEVVGPPELPEHRWSLRPSDLRRLGPTGSTPVMGTNGPETRPRGRFVASVGVGLVFADEAQPPRPVDPSVQAIATRLKDNFDPAGRFNPGRMLGRP
ncbi:MAG: FAD-binding protein [Actinomycetia bacterium]|nr:FAD-binding protein [Actinomycetes bacterium]MCP4227668.1 FAD-binding protein [Actinomycetes bacterium]MCP5034556.1 FAD-binding protein [Actinomycetes bacterium]